MYRSLPLSLSFNTHTPCTLLCLCLSLTQQTLTHFLSLVRLSHSFKHTLFSYSHTQSYSHTLSQILTLTQSFQSSIKPLTSITENFGRWILLRGSCWDKKCLFCGQKKKKGSKNCKFNFSTMSSTVFGYFQFNFQWLRKSPPVYKKTRIEF